MEKTLSRYIIGVIIICFFTMMNTCSSCSSSSNSKQTAKKVDSLQIIVKDLQMKYLNLATKKDLQIEGLKTEKRMIQSTDRKMLDVSRQGEIDKEIEKLQK